MPDEPEEDELHPLGEAIPASPALVTPAPEKVWVLRFKDAQLVNLPQGEADALVGAEAGRIATAQDLAVAGIGAPTTTEA